MDRNDELFARAQRSIPAGVNSPVRAFRAVGGTPRFLARGEGAYVWDADGRRYIDYVGSWGAAILGHAHPDAVGRVSRLCLSLGVIPVFVPPHEPGFQAALEAWSGFVDGHFKMFHEDCATGKTPFSIRAESDFGIRGVGVVRQAHPTRFGRAIGPECHVDVISKESVIGNQIASISKSAGLRQQPWHRPALLLGHRQIGFDCRPRIGPRQAGSFAGGQVEAQHCEAPNKTDCGGVRSSSRSRSPAQRAAAGLRHSRAAENLRGGGETAQTNLHGPQGSHPQHARVQLITCGKGN